MKQVLIALDQFLNALLGGWADETLSARAFRNSDKKRWANVAKVIDAIFFWQPNHCKGAWKSEVFRQHFPPDYRDKVGIPK